MTTRISSWAVLLAFTPAIAVAEPADDGYCDHVEGTAAATAAPLFAPELYGQFGYIEQPTFAVTPTGDPSNLRVIGGVRYSLTNLFAGAAIKSRARADCRRHKALLALRGATTHRALAARVRVYDEAQGEANRILQQVLVDLEAKRLTVPEATATRLRVEELRALAARTRAELAHLPPADERPLATLLAAYRGADADIEESEGTLRKVNAYDLSVRVGVERYLEGASQGTELVGVIQLSVNLGALRIGHHNDRAARGRARYARSGYDSLGANTTMLQLRATIDVQAKRAAEVTALVADLAKQMDALTALNGDQSKRFRETLWFDWIQAKAELAYLQSYVDALREVVAEAP